MTKRRISKMDTEQLNRLVSVLAKGTDPVAETAREDAVAQLLDCWLKSPVCVHPALLALMRQEAVDARHDQELPVTVSFGHLLFDTKTEVVALEAISRYARQLSVCANSEPESSAIFVLYWAAIASALAHHDARISSDSYESLAESLADLGTQKWMPVSLRDLFSHTAEISQAKRRDAPNSALKDDTGIGSVKGNTEVPPKGPDSQWLTASFNTPTERPGSQVSHYKLLDVLGEGGMGIVYRAWQDHPMKRQVALKVIKPGMDSRRIIARFEAERQALAFLDHPNIAHIYDAGTTESGRPYFVMEYVEGLPITEHCDRHKLMIEDRLRLFLQVCHAVQHAHQKGIIHRDIKPSNIVVSLQDGQSVPKIIDFGIAKALTAPLMEETLSTGQSLLFGTPEYMSPEQADMAKEDIDTRSDIYSLGVLLYVLLTGMLPFDTKDLRKGGVEHIRQVIREADPRVPSGQLLRLGEQAKKIAETRRMEVTALAKHLRKELEWIPLKAMRKERSDRYRSASELADDIENYLIDAPLIAGPPSTIYRLKKSVRRHKTFVAGSLAVLAASLIGTIVSTIFAIGEGHALAEAKAVSDFLQFSVLNSLDPFKVSGRQITIRSVLDAASKDLQNNFHGTPMAEAEIRHTIGFAYWSLGLFKLAELHYRRAVDICRAHLGNEDPKTLLWVKELGWVYLYDSRYDEAERLATETLERMQRVLAHDDELRLHTMILLASVYHMRGHFDEAEQLCITALDTLRHKKGEEYINLPSYMVTLAWISRMQGRYDEAEDLYKCGLKISLRELGERDFLTLMIKRELGELYHNQGRYGEAERLMLEALAGWQNAWGQEHPETLWTMSYLARLYYGQARYEEAESLFAKALETSRVVLGEAHYLTVLSMHGLGALYLSQGRYDEAESLLNEVLGIASHVMGEENWCTLRVMNTLAKLYEAQERYQMADSLFNETLKGRISNLGEDHPGTLETKNDLGVLHKEQGSYDKAEPLLLEALEGRRLKLGDTHPHTIESWNDLIDLYEAWNKPEEAEKWRAKLPETEAMRE